MLLLQTQVSDLSFGETFLVIFFTSIFVATWAYYVWSKSHKKVKKEFNEDPNDPMMKFFESTKKHYFKEPSKDFDRNFEKMLAEEKQKRNNKVINRSNLFRFTYIIFIISLILSFTVSFWFSVLSITAVMLFIFLKWYYKVIVD